MVTLSYAVITLFNVDSYAGKVLMAWVTCLSDFTPFVFSSSVSKLYVLKDDDTILILSSITLAYSVENSHVGAFQPEVHEQVDVPVLASSVHVPCVKQSLVLQVFLLWSTAVGFT